LERAYFELGQYGEINKLYERILEKDPNNAMALLGLANLASKKGEHDRALLQYRHVLEVDPDNLSARAGIIRILSQQNRWPQLSSEVDTLINSAAFNHAGYACATCGHHEPEAAWYCPQCKAVGTFGV
ncbi:MAG: tetratricopeptide repeat protein, partial [candidate division Zixibacteria bacterium]|nr:tetratricopeptide repeat protein [candidate division Zixibacteria bacterium]